MDNMNRGLEGLGVINTNNSSATIDQTSGNFGNNNVTTDERLFDNNLNRYASNVDFHNYVMNFLMNSGVVNVQQLTDADRQQLNCDNAFVVQMPTNNSMFTVFTCISYNDVLELIDKLSIVTNNNIPPRKVAIGLYNYDNSMSSNANKFGLELLGYDEILDINYAITSANNRAPYMNMKNNFEALLAKQLYEKYKQTATGSLGQQFSGQAAGIGSSLGAAFSEGLGQLKQSLFGLGRDLGVVKNNNGVNTNNTQPMSNQPVYNSEATQNLNNQMQNNMSGRASINLDKVDNPNINLSMETSEPSNVPGCKEHNLSMNVSEPIDVQAHHADVREINDNIVNNATHKTAGVSLSKK